MKFHRGNFYSFICDNNNLQAYPEVIFVLIGSYVTNIVHCRPISQCTSVKVIGWVATTLNGAGAEHCFPVFLDVMAEKTNPAEYEL
jgi:hypothetical protein